MDKILSSPLLQEKWEMPKIEIDFFCYLDSMIITDSATHRTKADWPSEGMLLAY